MIAGEGLVGIVLAILAVVGLDKAIDFSGKLAALGVNELVSTIGALVLFAVVITVVLAVIFAKNKKNSAE